jgi:DNA-binding MarR family transcriptional regulator
VQRYRHFRRAIIVKDIHDPGTVPAPEVADAAERLFELAAVFGEAMDGWLAERGLTRVRAEVLWRLGRQGAMTQRELSQALRCSARNVTWLVDALQDAALVSRRPHPSDRRAILVSLTERGTAAAAEMRARQQESAAWIFAEFSRTELAGLADAFARLLTRIRAAPAT